MPGDDLLRRVARSIREHRCQCPEARERSANPAVAAPHNRLTFPTSDPASFARRSTAQKIRPWHDTNEAMTTQFRATVGHCNFVTPTWRRHATVQSLGKGAASPCGDMMGTAATRPTVGVGGLGWKVGWPVCWTYVSCRRQLPRSKCRATKTALRALGIFGTGRTPGGSA